MNLNVLNFKPKKPDVPTTGQLTPRERAEIKSTAEHERKTWAFSKNATWRRAGDVLALIADLESAERQLAELRGHPPSP